MTIVYQTLDLRALAHWSATVMTPLRKIREPKLHYTIYHCILGNKLVKTGRKWSNLVKTGQTIQNWSYQVMTFLIQRPMRLLSELFGT